MDHNALLRRLQTYIYAVRRGQTNQILAMLILAILGAAAIVHPEWKEFPWSFAKAWPVYLTFGLGWMLAVWLLARLWRVAPVPPAPSDMPGPSAIKGLQPWGVAEGPLFLSLGRRAEIQKLLGFAQDDQIPITVVLGESGAGKTSLLQAGLRYTLGAEHCIYWEALPVNAPEALVRAIRNQFPDIDSLESLPASSKSRWVLIVDQFEQLHARTPEHLPIFDLLGKIAKATAPHRLSVVIGFRQEYAADWLHFEDAYNFRAERVFVKLMSNRVAADVIATLSNKAGFALDQALVDNLLFCLAQPQGISPLDISIGLESLADFAQQKALDQVTMDDYRLAGGAEGLLLSFVQQKLDEVPQHVRAQLLKGIVMSLVDLANNQRVAGGETSGVIATAAELPEEQLKPWLDRLTNPRVRLLERVGTNRYRLPHERLVPALRRLTGVALAALDQTKLLFESEYDRWRQMHHHRNLLSGRDLTDVLRHRDQLMLGENSGGRTEYIKACVGRRKMLRLASFGAGAAVLGAGYGVYRLGDAYTQRKALENWKLPPDLFAAQYDIDGLELYANITDLDWLRSKRVRELACKLASEQMAGVERLIGVTSLRLDPPDFATRELKQLKLPHNLTSFSLRLYGPEIESIANLKWPPNLTSLSLKPDLPNDPDLAGRQLDGLKLPLGLTSLSLDLDSEIGSLAHLSLPPALSSLALRLRASTIPGITAWEGWSTVTSLSLYSGTSRFPQIADLRWPPRLTSLSLADAEFSGRLAELRLPQRLTSLSLNYSDIQNLEDSLDSFPSISSLSIKVESPTPPDLTMLKFPKHLTSLSYELFLSDIQSLAELTLPQHIKFLALDIASSKIKNLKELEQLSDITSLRLKIRAPLLPEVLKLSFRNKITLWVQMGESKAVRNLPTGFKFLGLSV